MCVRIMYIVRMYVCVYMYMYVCMCVYMYVYVCVCICGGGGGGVYCYKYSAYQSSFRVPSCLGLLNVLLHSTEKHCLTTTL